VLKLAEACDFPEVTASSEIDSDRLESSLNADISDLVNANWSNGCLTCFIKLKFYLGIIFLCNTDISALSQSELRQPRELPNITIRQPKNGCRRAPGIAFG